MQAAGFDRPRRLSVIEVIGSGCEKGEEVYAFYEGDERRRAT